MWHALLPAVRPYGFFHLDFRSTALPSPAPCIRLAYTSYQDRIDGGFPDAALSSIIRKEQSGDSPGRSGP